jgi:hypothetical protein
MSPPRGPVTNIQGYRCTDKFLIGKKVTVLMTWKCTLFVASIATYQRCRKIIGKETDCSCPISVIVLILLSCLLLRG